MQYLILTINVGIAIFARREERDLLSLIFLGMEFQRNAPSYMKLLFILLVCGKQRLLEIFRRL